VNQATSKNLHAISKLFENERILILGASGWFGRSLRENLDPSTPILSIAGSKRDPFELWDLARISSFGPTVVANFAFLTKNRIAQVGLHRFTKTNKLLTQRFLLAAKLPSVRIALTVSSGAAVVSPESPYGAMKLEEEIQSLQLIDASRTVVIVRTYSVSGPYVRDPHTYAFSDFILQANQGTIRVNASTPVYRRYVSVDDLLKVSLSCAKMGQSGIIESGGELVEVGELAQRIRSIVNRSAKIIRPVFDPQPITIYASDNGTWASSCEAVNYEPRNLESQIVAATETLINFREMEGK